MCDTTHDTYYAEDDAKLLIEWYQEQVVIPRLTTTRYLLLLEPVVNALPDAIANASTNIGE